MGSQNDMDYRKGDQSSGGGGTNAGGGKKGRPMDGWEKGDLARDQNIQDNRDELTAKPGKQSKKLYEQRDKKDRENKESDEI